MEVGSGPKRLAWVAIACLACAFCYSIGFQFGWSEATIRADDRLMNMTHSFEGVIQNVHAETAGRQESRAVGETAISSW